VGASWCARTMTSIAVQGVELPMEHGRCDTGRKHLPVATCALCDALGPDSGLVVVVGRDARVILPPLRSANTDVARSLHAAGTFATERAVDAAAVTMARLGRRIHEPDNGKCHRARRPTYLQQRRNRGTERPTSMAAANSHTVHTRLIRTLGRLVAIARTSATFGGKRHRYIQSDQRPHHNPLTVNLGSTVSHFRRGLGNRLTVILCPLLRLLQAI